MKKLYIWAYLLLLATYMTLVFTLPTDPSVLAKHAITQSQARLLNLSIIVPVVLIYLSALYGFHRVREYSIKLQGSKDGLPFKHLANGLMVLAYSLPINSIFGSIVSYTRHRNPDMVTMLTVTRNYVSLIFAFVSIYLLALGAHGLHATLKQKRTVKSFSPFKSYVAPIALASIYTWLLTIHERGNASMDAFQLPNWLLVLTLGIPYAVAWCIGIQAAIHLNQYRSRVRGTIYRRALGYLSKGIAFIIGTSILIQCLTTLSGPLNRLRLTPLLLILYLLVTVYAVGFIFVARGAKKLKLIEVA